MPKGGDQDQKRALKHGAAVYNTTGRLPPGMQGFDTALAQELLEQAGGDPAFRLLATSAARRATLLELAYSWLARDDVKVFWTETVDGQTVVKWQPVLRWIGSYHEGLRRDLDALGLTPVSRAKLGLDNSGDLLGDALEAARTDGDRSTD